MKISLLFKLVLAQLLVFAPILLWVDGLSGTGVTVLSASIAICLLQGAFLFYIFKFYDYPRYLENLVPGIAGSRAMVSLYLTQLPILAMLTLLLASSKKLNSIFARNVSATKFKKLVLFLALSQYLLIPATQLYPNRYLLHYSNWFAQPGVQYLVRLSHELEGLSQEVSHVLEGDKDVGIAGILELLQDGGQTSSGVLAVLGVLHEYQKRPASWGKVSQFRQDFMDLVFIEIAIGVLVKSKKAPPRLQIFNPMNILLPNLLFETLLASSIDVGTNLYAQSILEEEILKAFKRLETVREGETQELIEQRMNVVLRLKSEFKNYKQP